MTDFSAFPLLSVITFMPLVGALACLVCGSVNMERQEANIKNVAIFTSLINLMLSLVLWLNFNTKDSDFQFVESYAWFPSLGINYYIGVDGISLFFIILSATLIPICIIASWDNIKHRVREYMMAFLLLECFMIGMFVALDIVVFYIFFEAVLIPMFLIIGIWGGQNRTYAAYKFFLYTLAGSILMLVAVLVLYNLGNTTSIPDLAGLPISITTQYWLWLALFASFAVKIPMWPFHTWLPDAHVQAPTAGSVILASVLLKMGAYGFLRFSIPILPLATDFFIPVIFALSIIAVIYASLVALVQTDIKKLIAYSSIAHMGFVTVGIFALTTEGVTGAIFQMLSHGVVSGALFLCVGVIYDRMHTREMSQFGGIVHTMPKYAVLMLLFTMASVGLPGTSGFVGEFLVLLGVFEVSTVVATLVALGIILGAVYALKLYRNVILGSIENSKIKLLKDLSQRELVTLAPLALIILWMGIYPKPFLNVIEPSVERLIAQYHTSLASYSNNDIKLVEQQP